MALDYACGAASATGLLQTLYRPCQLKLHGLCLVRYCPAPVASNRLCRLSH